MKEISLFLQFQKFFFKNEFILGIIISALKNVKQLLCFCALISAIYTFSLWGNIST